MTYLGLFCEFWKGASGSPTQACAFEGREAPGNSP